MFKKYLKRTFGLNKALRVLLGTNAIILISAAMLIPIYAIFVEEIGGSLMDSSIASGIFALVAGITTFVSGNYTDKVKRKELVVVCGYGIMGIGFLMYLLVDNIWFLFYVQAIIGIGEAIYSPAFDSLYSKNIKKKKAGLQWGAWESMNYITAAIGAFVGGIVVTFLGFDVLFIIMACLCFFSAAYIYLLKEKIL